LKFAPIGCRSLRRSSNHRENAPGSSAGAKFDVGDFEKSIAGAEICSIRAEKSAPALPAARIGRLNRAEAEILLRSGCKLLRRSRNQRENAPESSGGAKVDVVDFEKSIAGAEICSIGAENNMPALPAARIERRYRAGANVCSDRARIALGSKNQRGSAQERTSEARLCRVPIATWRLQVRPSSFGVRPRFRRWQRGQGGCRRSRHTST
jgi:hypothetical protein